MKQSGYFSAKMNVCWSITDNIIITITIIIKIVVCQLKTISKKMLQQPVRLPIQIGISYQNSLFVIFLRGTTEVKGFYFSSRYTVNV